MSYAFRNIRLCVKDCMCLFVCPTGATNHESGQIDASKCLDGCRACVDACPEHAISLKPSSYPPPQDKTSAVSAAMLDMAAAKCRQELIARDLAGKSPDSGAGLLARSLEKSMRIAAEDMIREAGFMLPQSRNSLTMLRNMAAGAPGAEFPAEAVDRLIALLIAEPDVPDNY
ncbi:MAG: 4Fe-4S ferredoxin [Victivallaceae bacterium]